MSLSSINNDRRHLKIVALERHPRRSAELGDRKASPVQPAPVCINIISKTTVIISIIDIKTFLLRLHAAGFNAAAVLAQNFWRVALPHQLLHH